MEWDWDCIHSMPWQTIPASKFLVEKGYNLSCLFVQNELVLLAHHIYNDNSNCWSCSGPMWALWLAPITSCPWLPWQISWRGRRSARATCPGSCPPRPGGVTYPSHGTSYALVPGVVTPQSVDHPTPALSAMKKGEQSQWKIMIFINSSFQMWGWNGFRKPSK